jgi:hypothetical protein
MGCDIHNLPERPPYCTPKCEEFKLISHAFGSGEVRAECKRCGLHHDVTLKDGLLLIGIQNKVVKL